MKTNLQINNAIEEILSQLKEVQMNYNTAVIINNNIELIKSLVGSNEEVNSDVINDKLGVVGNPDSIIINEDVIMDDRDIMINKNNMDEYSDLLKQAELWGSNELEGGDFSLERVKLRIDILRRSLDPKVKGTYYIYTKDFITFLNEEEILNVDDNSEYYRGSADVGYNFLPPTKQKVYRDRPESPTEYSFIVHHKRKSGDTLINTQTYICKGASDSTSYVQYCFDRMAKKLVSLRKKGYLYEDSELNLISA